MDNIPRPVAKKYGVLTRLHFTMYFYAEVIVLISLVMENPIKVLATIAVLVGFPVMLWCQE